MKCSLSIETLVEVVSVVMDPEPLIVDANTPIESVAKAAMERE